MIGYWEPCPGAGLPGVLRDGRVVCSGCFASLWLTAAHHTPRHVPALYANKIEHELTRETGTT